MAGDITNIRIEPMQISWEQNEQWNLTCVADVAGSLGGKYFTLASGDAATQYYVWFDTGADADPAPAGRTGLEVTISSGDSASAVATAAAAIIDANADFQASSSGAVLTIDAIDIGDPGEDIVDVDTGFTFVQCADGGIIDLGLTDGDIACEFEQSLFDVTAHQEGTSVLGQLRQGVSAEIAITLKESDAAKYKEIFVASSGGATTPGGGTELFGWGSSRLGDNAFVEARRLVLHPVRLASGDNSEDVCFWKTHVMPGTLTFSGESPQTLSLSFKAFLDRDKADEVELFCIGDYTQLLPA